MAQKALVFFSGGLDSTAALYKLLRETDFEINAHFVKFDTSKSKREERAVRSLLPLLYPIRPFQFTFSHISNSALKRPHSIYSYRFMASLICIEQKFDYCVSGHAADDNTPHNLRDFDRLTAIFESTGAKAEWLYPVSEMHKQEECDLLPDDIFKLIWFCEYGKLCGEKCKSCLRMKSKAPAGYSRYLVATLGQRQAALFEQASR